MFDDLFNSKSIFLLNNLDNYKNINLEKIDIKEINNPLIKGIDINNNKFIIIKVIINFCPVNLTFYYDNIWKNLENNFLKSYDNVLSKIQLKLIKDIVQNNFVKINKSHNIINSKFIDYKIQLYDKLIWDSVIKIQRYWRNARYNCKYKIFKKYEKIFLKSILEDNNIIIKDFNSVLSLGNNLFNECNELVDKIYFENN